MAPGFSWTEECCVGVDEIDEQHKKIFQFINDLSCALNEKKKKVVVEDIIMRMVDYAVYHFNTEEKYLANHTDFRAHRRQHDLFTRKILFYRDAVNEDPDAIGREAVEFLEQWLEDHILYLDKRDFSGPGIESVAG